VEVEDNVIVFDPQEFVCQRFETLFYADDSFGFEFVIYDYCFRVKVNSSLIALHIVISEQEPQRQSKHTHFYFSLVVTHILASRLAKCQRFKKEATEGGILLPHESDPYG
jgi:hypothetical protein